jgi:hypothetical protein
MEAKKLDASMARIALMVWTRSIGVAMLLCGLINLTALIPFHHGA